MDFLNFSIFCPPSPFPSLHQTEGPESCSFFRPSNQGEEEILLASTSWLISSNNLLLLLLLLLPPSGGEFKGTEGNWGKGRRSESCVHKKGSNQKPALQCTFNYKRNKTMGEEILLLLQRVCWISGVNSTAAAGNVMFFIQPSPYLHSR